MNRLGIFSRFTLGWGRCDLCAASLIRFHTSTNTNPEGFVTLAICVNCDKLAPKPSAQIADFYDTDS